MTRWLRHTLYLNAVSLLFMVAGAGAHESQSTAITIDPGQSIVQSAQLTLPVVTTTTAVSVVTVTQMSMQTTTAVVTQMQTVVVAATCAAASPAGEPQNSQEVVTARPLDTSAAVSSPAPSSSTPADTVTSSVSTAALVASSASPERCDCSCLCPMAAFPMAAYQMAPNTTQAVATSNTQMSTFTTVVTTAVTTAVVGNLIVVSSVGTPPSTGDAKATASTPSAMNSSTSPPATIPTKVTGALPSDIVTDPAVRQKNAQDAPFDINNFALMTSVNLPVIVGPAAEPTAGG